MRQNVFISPMKGEQSLAQSEMTPRSRQLYSFGDLHVSRLAPEKKFLFTRVCTGKRENFKDFDSLIKL